MMEKVIYVDFENFKTKKQVEFQINKRIKDLKKMNFSNTEIYKIIFDDNNFRTNFLENINFYQLKEKYKVLL
ncbi:MAG: hypothetical protein GXO80_00885 [Chlorobi bacterium]|nr:hypothetical protein [Chlorobiota bacterium]